MSQNLVAIPAAADAASVRPKQSIRRIEQQCGADVYRRVAAHIIDEFAVSEADLRFRSRGSTRAALARQVAMYLCHVGFALSLGTIGKLFGRDRTTVAHACRMIEERREDIGFDSRIAALECICGVSHATGVS